MAYITNDATFIHEEFAPVSQVNKNVQQCAVCSFHKIAYVLI
jgi:hypothetical protein